MLWCSASHPNMICFCVCMWPSSSGRVARGHGVTLRRGARNSSAHPLTCARARQYDTEVRAEKPRRSRYYIEYYARARARMRRMSVMIFLCVAIASGVRIESTYMEHFRGGAIFLRHLQAHRYVLVCLRELHALGLPSQHGSEIWFTKLSVQNVNH